LQRHHSTAEKAGEYNNRQAPDSDDVHLQQNVVSIMRSAKYVAKGATTQINKVLQCKDGPFDKFEQSAAASYQMLTYCLFHIRV
jgi:hypothetical protein